jgi:hypothetical protein
VLKWRIRVYHIKIELTDLIVVKQGGNLLYPPSSLEPEIFFFARTKFKRSCEQRPVMTKIYSDVVCVKYCNNMVRIIISSIYSHATFLAPLFLLPRLAKQRVICRLARRSSPDLQCDYRATPSSLAVDTAQRKCY